VSVLVAIKGVAPCFAAREGLGVSLVGGGKGIAKGPLPVLQYTYIYIYIHIYIYIDIYI